MDDGLEDWFRRKILPCERALMRYLSRRRAMPIDAEDLRNDVYIRVLESAERSRPTVPRAFLFSTARNLLIDLARRNRVVAIDLLEDLVGVTEATGRTSRPIGPWWENPDAYLQNSPLFHATGIHTPLLLIHGDRDQTVYFT